MDTDADTQRAGLPPEGLVDLHCHLIPEVDDGCVSLDDTLDCISQFIERGFSASICTPHVMPSLFPDNTPANIAEWTNLLQEAVNDAGLDYRLLPGGELRIAGGMTDWMNEHGVPTLAGGRHVLIDLWEGDWPEAGDEICRYLLNRGYTPILAHPERMPLADDVIEKLLGRLAAMGVWLQGNFNSLAGGEGPVAAVRAGRWLREGRYALLASDAHKPRELEGRFEGLAMAEIEAGPEILQQLLVDRPRQIVGMG